MGYLAPKTKWTVFLLGFSNAGWLDGVWHLEVTDFERIRRPKKPRLLGKLGFWKKPKVSAVQPVIVEEVSPEATVDPWKFGWEMSISKGIKFNGATGIACILVDLLVDPGSRHIQITSIVSYSFDKVGLKELSICWWGNRMEFQNTWFSLGLFGWFLIFSILMLLFGRFLVESSTHQEPDGAWQGTRQELSKGTEMCFIAGVMVSSIVNMDFQNHHELWRYQDMTKLWRYEEGVCLLVIFSMFFVSQPLGLVESRLGLRTTLCAAGDHPRGGPDREVDAELLEIY